MITDLKSNVDIKAAEEGSLLIKKFLETWLSRIEGTDVDGDQNMDETQSEQHITELRRCFQEFEPLIQANPWCKELLASL
jgi:hypothetical protein